MQHDSNSPAVNIGLAHQIVNQQKIAKFVAVAAVGLPVAAAVLGSVDGCLPNSVSASLFMPYAGLVFVALLGAVVMFLAAYSGEPGTWDNLVAAAFAVALAGVACFPTNTEPCEGEFNRAAIYISGSQQLALMHGVSDVAEPTEEDKDAQVIKAKFFQRDGVSHRLHFVSAVFVIGFLVYFCLHAFTRVTDRQRGQDGKPTPEKLRRNRHYRLCALIIVFAVMVFLLARTPIISAETWASVNGTFWVEATVFTTFAYAWALKGGLWKLGELRDDFDARARAKLKV